MSFDPPPSAEDVDLEDYGAYSRRELVMARATLLRTVKESQSGVWQRLKYKMGMLPDGRRLHPDGPELMWIPSELPPLWSAPVALHDPQAQLSADQVQLPEADLSLRGKIPWGAGAVTHSSKKPGSRSESVASSSSTSFVPITVSSDSGEENGGHRGSLSKETIVVSDSEGCDFKFKVGKAGAGPSASTSDPQETAFSQTKMYDVMYHCDLCSILLQDEHSMAQHLQLKGHHSASRYLGFVDPSSGELRPKFVCVISALKDERYLFRYKIPTCPLCHEFFTDLRQCVDHCAASHQAPGMYSLRGVCQLQTVKLKRKTNKCLVCNKTFNEHSLRGHIAQTLHMVEPNLMIFPCDFCDRVHSDIIDHKRHLLSDHEEKTGIKKTIPVLCVTLHTAQPPMQLLPQDPGIPAARISGDACELHAAPKTVCADNNHLVKKRRGAKKVINFVMRRFQSARGKPIIRVLTDEEKARKQAKADRKKARRIALQKKKTETKRHGLRHTPRQDSGFHSQEFTQCSRDSQEECWGASNNGNHRHNDAQWQDLTDLPREGCADDNTRNLTQKRRRTENLNEDTRLQAEWLVDAYNGNQRHDAAQWQDFTDLHRGWSADDPNGNGMLNRMQNQDLRGHAEFQGEWSAAAYNRNLTMNSQQTQDLTAYAEFQGERSAGAYNRNRNLMLNSQQTHNAEFQERSAAAYYRNLTINSPQNQDLTPNAAAAYYRNLTINSRQNQDLTSNAAAAYYTNLTINSPQNQDLTPNSAAAYYRNLTMNSRQNQDLTPNAAVAYNRNLTMNSQQNQDLTANAEFQGEWSAAAYNKNLMQNSQQTQDHSANAEFIEQSVGVYNRILTLNGQQSQDHTANSELQGEWTAAAYNKNLMQNSQQTQDLTANAEFQEERSAGAFYRNLKRNSQQEPFMDAYNGKRTRSSSMQWQGLREDIAFHGDWSSGVFHFQGNQPQRALGRQGQQRQDNSSFFFTPILLNYSRGLTLSPRASFPF